MSHHNRTLATILSVLRVNVMLLLVGFLSVVPLVSPVAGQETDPPESTDTPAPQTAPTTPLATTPLPENGEVVLADPLAAPGALFAGGCPGRRNAFDFVGEGLILKVTGRCNESDTIARVSQRIPRLTLSDGELRLDVKAVSGQDRARFALIFRQQTGTSYWVEIEPAHGLVQLSVVANRERTVWAQWHDTSGLIDANGWNSLAVRAQGPNLWVLVNDQTVLVLSANDASYDAGAVNIGLQRLGDMTDDQETAVVIRNLGSGSV